jgi:hypothetical protein
MSLRLSGVAGGDPRDSARYTIEPEKVSESEERRKQQHHDSPTAHTDTYTTNKFPSLDYIPVATKTKLREIVLKSRDPRKSLDYIRSRVDDFLNQKDPRIGREEESRSEIPASSPRHQTRPVSGGDNQDGQVTHAESNTEREEAPSA